MGLIDAKQLDLDPATLADNGSGQLTVVGGVGGGDAFQTQTLQADPAGGTVGGLTEYVLPNTPSDPDAVTITLDDGTIMFQPGDFDVVDDGSGNIRKVVWTNPPYLMETLLGPNQKFNVNYGTGELSGSAVVTGGIQTKQLNFEGDGSGTVYDGAASQTYFDLPETPSDPLDVIVFIVGGSIQVNGTDFSVIDDGTGEIRRVDWTSLPSPNLGDEIELGTKIVALYSTGALAAQTAPAVAVLPNPASFDPSGLLLAGGFGPGDSVQDALEILDTIDSDIVPLEDPDANYSGILGGLTTGDTIEDALQALDLLDSSAIPTDDTAPYTGFLNDQGITSGDPIDDVIQVLDSLDTGVIKTDSGSTYDGVLGPSGANLTPGTSTIEDVALALDDLEDIDIPITPASLPFGGVLAGATNVNEALEILDDSGAGGGGSGTLIQEIFVGDGTGGTVNDTGGGGPTSTTMTLANTPTSANSVVVQIAGGTIQLNGTDFSVSGNVVTILGTYGVDRLADEIDPGTNVVVIYSFGLAGSDSGEVTQVEFFETDGNETVFDGAFSQKYIDLSQTPLDKSTVRVSIVGGSAQINKSSANPLGAVLPWDFDVISGTAGDNRVSWDPVFVPSAAMGASLPTAGIVIRVEYTTGTVGATAASALSASGFTDILLGDTNVQDALDTLDTHNHTAVVEAQTSVFQLDATHNNKIIAFTVGSQTDIDLNDDVSLPVGWQCAVIQLGAGQANFDDTGDSSVLVNAEGHTKTKQQYSVVSLVKVDATPTFVLTGSTGT
jgi:hypothetical protein